MGLLPPVVPANVTAPLVVTAYCVTFFPTWKKFVPARLIDIEIWLLELNVFTRSASRPPQPVVGGLSGTLLCHWTCWSLCEKSCGGSGTELALYCAEGRGIDERAHVREQRGLARAEEVVDFLRRRDAARTRGRRRFSAKSEGGRCGAARGWNGRRRRRRSRRRRRE